MISFLFTKKLVANSLARGPWIRKETPSVVDMVGRPWTILGLL
jgi:hypothetical protein